MSGQAERERLRALDARDEREAAKYRAEYDARRQEWEERQKQAQRNRNIAEAGLYGGGGGKPAGAAPVPGDDDMLSPPGRGRPGVQRPGSDRDGDDAPGRGGRDRRYSDDRDRDDGLSAVEKARLRREKEREEHEAALLAARKQAFEDRYGKWG